MRPTSSHSYTINKVTLNTKQANYLNFTHSIRHKVFNISNFLFIKNKILVTPSSCSSVMHILFLSYIFQVYKVIIQVIAIHMVNNHSTRAISYKNLSNKLMNKFYFFFVVNRKFHLPVSVGIQSKLKKPILMTARRSSKSFYKSVIRDFIKTIKPAQSFPYSFHVNSIFILGHGSNF